MEWNAFLWPIEDLPLLKARMRRTGRPWERRLIAFLKENAAYRRYVLRELEQRGPLLSREIEDHAPAEARGAPLVGRAEDGTDARRAERARRGRGRRPARQAARLGPRRALVPGDGDDLVGGGGAASEEQAVPLAGRAARRGRWIAHPDADDGPCLPRARRSSRRSTSSSTTATARTSSGTSSTGSRCTCRRRSASTATTCCRSCKRRPRRRPHRAGARPQGRHARGARHVVGGQAGRRRPAAAEPRPLAGRESR